jgi:hypothetical protein
VGQRCDQHRDARGRLCDRLRRGRSIRGYNDHLHAATRATRFEALETTTSSWLSAIASALQPWCTMRSSQLRKPRESGYFSRQPWPPRLIAKNPTHTVGPGTTIASDATHSRAHYGYTSVQGIGSDIWPYSCRVAIFTNDPHAWLHRREIMVLACASFNSHTAQRRNKKSDDTSNVLFRDRS